MRPVGYFVVLAEELHFGRAADRIGLTQPALSRSISNLETRVQARLVARSTRSVQLTRSGEVFLVLARELLDRQAEALEQLRALETDANGQMPSSGGHNECG